MKIERQANLKRRTMQ